MHIGQHSAYALGQEQNAEGVLRENNPFHCECVERSAWFAGWDSFQPIREQFEADTYDRCRNAD